ncbi:MAG: hypothetical protein M3Z08_17535 [Chloroflexota bacterium]|nr:hypothetical protein [Chloroflexota bacterium]
MGKNQRPFWNAVYLAPIMEAIVCYAWFTGRLAPLLALAYLLLIGGWFILS